MITIINVQFGDSKFPKCGSVKGQLGLVHNVKVQKNLTRRSMSLFKLRPIFQLVINGDGHHPGLNTTIVHVVMTDTFACK